MATAADAPAVTPAVPHSDANHGSGSHDWALVSDTLDTDFNNRDSGGFVALVWTGVDFSTAFLLDGFAHLLQ